MIERSLFSGLAGGALATVLAVTGGCGAASSDARTCSTVTPAITGATTGDPVRDQAEAKQMAILDALFGRYVRGDVGVYRGTVMARDNGSIYATPLDPGYTDHTMTSNAAIARLVVDGDSQATLTVFSPSEAEYVAFGQSPSAPGVTTANGILADNQTGGPAPACMGCAPDLLAQPATIAWTNEDAVATATDTGVNADYHVVSSVSLQLASPCSLTWDDLVALDATIDTGRGLGLGSFSKVGGAMVLHTGGSIVTVVPALSGTPGQYVPYTVDLYVNLANFADYGLRNYVAGAPVTYTQI